MSAIIDSLHRVYLLGKEMYPDPTIDSAKHRITMFLAAMLRISRICQWFRISDNPWLTSALQKFPLISGAIYWPYINHRWSLEERLAAIDQHYRMLNGPATILAVATFGAVEITHLDQNYRELRLVLDKASWFAREGEITLSLFIGERRIYTVAFTLGIADGSPLILVGALQGSNMGDSKSLYRELTHALHGLRPRDLLMIALKQFGKEFGIHRIWAVSNADRQHNSPYFVLFRKDKIQADFDQIWTEHQGERLKNGFFTIPVHAERKEVSQIPTRKRKTYRLRYQLLDQIERDIAMACARAPDTIQAPPIPAVLERQVLSPLG